VLPLNLEPSSNSQMPKEVKPPPSLLTSLNWVLVISPSPELLSHKENLIRKTTQVKTKGVIMDNQSIATLAVEGDAALVQKIGDLGHLGVESTYVAQ